MIFKTFLKPQIKKVILTTKLSFKNNKKQFKSFLTLFINYLMLKGLKEKSFNITRKLIFLLKQKLNLNFYKIFRRLILKTQPYINSKKRVKSGSTFNMPYILSRQENQLKVLKWLIYVCREKKNISILEGLLNEIILALKNQGSLIKKKDEINSILKLNRSHIK